jgi:cellulose synthase/poly-beta-1,6-N-acetylglucosamine synthase-like glycosyltransferase
MRLVVSAVWLVWCALSLVPILVLLAEVMMGVAGKRSPLPRTVGKRPRLAILVPAHDEGNGIHSTLRGLSGILQGGDRLLVVADNCTDDTAVVARNAGAEVIERFDDSRRGKGYALDFGIRHLQSNPPDVVVVVDADCETDAASMESISGTAALTGRPVQALYLMNAPHELGIGGRIAAFAWRVKNLVRPMGLGRMGFPCQLMGTGMAFPWEVIARANLASGHIVEDMQLGLDLAVAGFAPLFDAEATVTSQFASNSEGASSQRTRWEHGHLQMILSRTPALAWHGLRSGNGNLVALALDLLVPPLALLTLTVSFTAAISLLMNSVGLVPACLLGFSLVNLVLLVFAIGLAWWCEGRQVVSARDLLLAPLYALRKIPVYLGFFSGRQKKWIRSKRDN